MPARPRYRRVRRAPGTVRPSSRLPRVPRPLTHRRPPWRALAVATTFTVATAAVGGGAALAWAPTQAGGPTPIPVGANTAAGGDPPPAAVCTARPNAFNLASVFGKTLQDRLARQKPRFQGDTYGLSYGYDITSERVSGKDGTINAVYHGTAYRKGSGRQVTRSGTAKASFQWAGCTWVVTHFSD